MERIQAEELIAKAAADAIAAIGKMGWKYTITTTDGRVLTNMEPPLKKITRKKLYSFKNSVVPERLEASCSGEVICFPLPEGVPAPNFQKHVVNCATNVYGTGNFRTKFNKVTKELVLTCGSRTALNDLDAAIAAVAEANKQTHSVTNTPQ